MMVETILESSQDFGMSNGSLPQWKRELLQRRLARARPCAVPVPPPPPPPPLPPPADEDEELRYGPGIVKRLKSRYLSLALRDAPRRRPSVLRRAASLEHLLDERPPPAPRARAPRPASLAAAPALAPRQPVARRESVKRARSVDALSRLDLREEPPAPPSPSPPPRPPAAAARAARPPRRAQPLLRDAERPPPDVVRSTLRKFESAPTRRPAPAARISAVLRGLEPRRSASPDGSECAPPPRSPSPRAPLESPLPPASPPPPLPTETPPPPVPTETPPPIPTTPTPIADPSPSTPPPIVFGSTRPVSPSEPELPSPIGSPTPPPFVQAPRIELRIDPSPKVDLSPKIDLAPKIDLSPKIDPPPRIDLPSRPDLPPKAEPSPKIASVPKTAPTSKIILITNSSPLASRSSSAASPAIDAADEVEGCAASSATRRVSRAALEEIARAGSSVRYAFSAPGAAEHLPPLSATNPVLAARGLRRVGVIRPMPPAARPTPPPPPPEEAKAAAGRLAAPEPERPAPPSALVEPMPRAAESPERAALVNGHSTPEPSSLSRIGAAGIERAWSGSGGRRGEAGAVQPSPLRETPERKPSWLRTAGSRPRAPPPQATSVVFNFSNRKEVPDYIENDGIILRGSRRNRIKGGEPGVVVLRPDAAGSDAEEEEARPPSPCDVRFVNDNVLINGKSSMPGKPNKDRISKLKLQFDDSLTRTFEYPSETSMSEDFAPSSPPAPAPAPQDNGSLTDNTHIASAALSRYTPSKTCAAAFQLGLTNPHQHEQVPAVNGTHADAGADETDADAGGAAAGAGGAGEEGDARPCGADAAKSWSDARAHRTDLLF